MRHPWTTNLRAAAVLSLGVAAAIAGCHDFGEPHAGRGSTVDSVAIRRAHARLLAQVMAAASDTARCSTLNGDCTVTVTESPASYQSPSQTSPITATFSKPVYKLIVFGSGAFQCSGTYGTVTVYNRGINGIGQAQVEQRDFILYDPSDCGYDNVAGSDVDTLQFPGGIAKVVIDPPQPWEFPVPTSDTTPPATGHVWINYFYSFYQQRPATAPCPTGDELLDQQEMRAFLAEAWDSSHFSYAPGNRRETPGFLFEDSTGNLVYRLYQDLMNDTPCRSAGTPVGPLPGIPIAEGHTHPFAPKDTLPPSCYKQPLNPGQFRQYDIKKYGGASDSDLVRMRDDSLPFYILDRDTIYAYPVGTTRKNAKSVVKRYPRVDAQTGCVRV